MPEKARRKEGWLCLWAGLLGFCLFWLVYGLRPLNPTYDAWIFNNYIETDIVQAYSGWLAYRAAPGLLPLTWSPLIQFPFGSYTSLADSIPLMEVVCKLLSPLLPATFQYFGLLCAASLMLQSICAALLLRLFTEDKVCCLLGSVLFTLSPVLLERVFRHSSLSAHWLLLLALRQYILLRRQHRPAHYGVLALLAVLSVWQHLYFTPMILGLFLAAVLDEWVGGSRSPKGALWLCAGTAGAFVSAKVLGILGMGLDNTSGYGFMGMNLNALFNPVSLDENWWVPGYGRMHWSRFLPMRALAENNLESFNYLGLGVLLLLGTEAALLCVGLVRRREKAVRMLAQTAQGHPFLLLFCLCSAAFAVSNVVCAFSYVLVRIPLPQLVLKICSAFRASGRLFWSVYYLLFLAGLVVLLRCAPKGLRWGRLLLAAVVLVQVLDISPVLLHKHQRFTQEETFYAQSRTDAMLDACDGADTLYFLELYEERALCGQLLKRGMANNLLLISREGYGVTELQTDMQRVRAELLNGEDPYPNCAYATKDGELAAQLEQNGQGTLRFENELYLYLPG